ncbi:MAG: hypothetical protein IKS47_01985 [Bacteroidales bacterium]|nr:hypothetical protein [Bacteroidales bacterium]
MNRIIVMMALLGGLLWGCQSIDAVEAIEEIDPQENPDERIENGERYTLTVEAVKHAGTKAMALENGALSTYWVQDEKVGVYVNGAYCGQLLATPKTDATKATLRGEVTSTTGIEKDATILLLYPDRTDIDIQEGTKWDYTGQNGAAPKADGTGDLSAKYDYATATLTVTGVNGNDVSTSGTATFQNQQSIYRLDFKVEGTPRRVNWFSVSSSQNKLVTSRSYDNGWTSACGSLSVSLASSTYSPYLSLRNENTTEADTYTFWVRDDKNDLFTGTKEIETQYLGYGKFLAPSVDLSAYSITTQASGDISNSQDIF